MMSPFCTPAFSAGPPAVTRATSSRPPISSVVTPSQGRAGADTRPSAIRSARIGGRRSIGTNMLPGSPSPLPPTSRTMSEPTPTSLPSRLISAAPLQTGCGGVVKIAASSRYSQLPANSRTRTTWTGATMSVPPKLATSAGSFSLRSADLPSPMGRRLSGVVALKRPKPVSWS